MFIDWFICLFLNPHVNSGTFTLTGARRISLINRMPQNKGSPLLVVGDPKVFGDLILWHTHVDPFCRWILILKIWVDDHQDCPNWLNLCDLWPWKSCLFFDEPNEPYRILSQPLSNNQCTNCSGTISGKYESFPKWPDILGWWSNEIKVSLCLYRLKKDQTAWCFWRNHGRMLGSSCWC